MFYSFLSSLARSQYLSLFVFLTLICSRFSRLFFLSPFFKFLTITRSDRLGDIMYLLVSQNPREIFASHSPGHIPGCAYTTCSYGQIQIFCTIPIWSPFPPNSSKSYSLLGANLLHSFIICLSVSFLSPNNLNLLFCCVLCIFHYCYCQCCYCPVGLGCGTYRLLLCRGVRPPQWVSLIWH